MLEFGLFHGAGYQRHNAIVVVTFGKVIEGSVLNGLYAVGNGAVGSKQDDFDEGKLLFDTLCQFNSVRIRQFYVANNNLNILFF